MALKFHLQKFHLFLLIISATAFSPLMACSIESEQRPTPALFNSKIEAENAAKNFNCSGAHKMGGKWMPCKSHKAYGGNEKHKTHDHHQSH